MLHRISNELLPISAYLTLKENYELRFAIKTRLTKLKLNPRYFDESLKKQIDYEAYMSINRNYITNWDAFAIYLIKKEQYGYFSIIKPEYLRSQTVIYISHHRIGDLYGLQMLAGTQMQSILVSKCRYGYTESVKYLIAHMDPSLYDNEALVTACEFGNAGVVEALLKDDRIDPSTMSNEPIRKAAKNGHLEIVEMLMSDKRVDPGDKCNEALANSCYFGHYNVVVQLLHHQRVNPAANDNEPIRLAALNGHCKIVECLLQYSRVNPCAKHNQAYCLADLGKHARVMELLGLHS
ncbi:hypothetical protein HDV01_003509 [Terramyces sp. JEL0728]|nr:hypothetical protein HDV01_003509 [Terramyces sp. JEL0728]